MADMLGNALSALVSYQRALATTGHNIANADTDGYSRQRIDFVTRVPQQLGGFSIGSGVAVADVRRVYDQFASSQLRSASGGFAQLEAFHQLASQLDNSLSDPELGLSAALSRFYDSVQNLADDPGSMSSRQLLLSEAEGLSSRFRSFASQFEALNSQVNERISVSINDINDLAKELADINQLVVEGQGKFGGAASDLLDRRDQILLQLNDIVSIKSVAQDDGAVNVFVGSGQSLVLGQEVHPLAAQRNAFDPQRLEIVSGGAQGGVISSVIGGGSLGATLSFRDGLLADSRNELGRIATALADGVNSQNNAGIDFYGNRGGDIFAAIAPQTVSASTNSGSATAIASIADIGALTGRNITLQFDGSNWRFNDAGSGQSISDWSGSGSLADPFIVDGVSLYLDAPAAAGDRFLLQPTQGAAGQLTVVMTDAAQLAAAAATRSGADAANVGAAQISETRIVDADNPNLTNAVDISFVDANSYQINGSGSFAYSPGAEIAINGNVVSISGSPAAGDRFTIQANNGASGDNRNMLAMAALEQTKLLNGGSASVQERVNGLVGDIAVATRSAELNRDAQQNLLNQTRANVEAISGVNLDEEAANLLKYQQAYQAAAQATSVANDLFQSLMAAMR